MTPLKLAMANSVSRNILLGFMSKVDANASYSIRNLFPQLIADQNFKQYLDSLPKQTYEMRIKTGISVSYAINDQIIGVYPSVA